MKISTIIITIGAVFITTASVADTYVRGHTRNNGAYVQPHMRTNPDRTMYNNYSTRGNVNPYTGRAGTVKPYSRPRNGYSTRSAPRSNNYGNYNSSRRSYKPRY